jgi:hypothetical protein
MEGANAVSHNCRFCALHRVPACARRLTPRLVSLARDRESCERRLLVETWSVCLAFMMSRHAHSCLRRFQVLLSTLALSGCSLVLGDLPPKVKDGGARDAMSSPELDAEVPDDTQQDDAEVDEAAAEPVLDATEPASMEDAGEPDADLADAADESCDAAVAWYADDDGDGFGTGEAQVTCPKPSGRWAREAGDCQDGDPRVFPRQALYFGAPYRGRDGNDSYDFDCSGFEEGNPQQPHLRDGCGLLELAACQGSGYARTQRAGLLQNSVCGSLVIDTCEAKLLAILLCGATSHTTTEPYLCH